MTTHVHLKVKPLQQKCMQHTFPCWGSHLCIELCQRASSRYRAGILQWTLAAAWQRYGGNKSDVGITVETWDTNTQAQTPGNSVGKHLYRSVFTVRLSLETLSIQHETLY